MVPRSSKRQASFCGCSLFTPAVQGKIRRTAGDEIKFFIRRGESRPIPEIALANFVALCQVRCSARIFAPAPRFQPALRPSPISRPANATRRSGPPCQCRCPDPAPAVRVGHQRRAIPGRQDVIGGKAMSVAQLKQPEMAADGIQGLVGLRRPAERRSPTRRGGIQVEAQVGVHALTCSPDKLSLNSNDGAPSPGGTGPGLAQPLKWVSNFISCARRAQRLDVNQHVADGGNFRADLVLHRVGDLMRAHHRHLRIHLDVHVRVKAGSPSCAQNIFPPGPRRESSPQLVSICSMISWSGERSISSLNAGRSSRQPLKAMTQAAASAAQLSAFS